MDFKVDILGRTWQVLVINPSEDERLNDCDGFTDFSALQMVIGDRRNESNMKYPMSYLMKVLRHEIIHAFMYESGLAENWSHDQGQDEMIVDWFAMQVHKIETACDKAETELIKGLYD